MLTKYFLSKLTKTPHKLPICYFSSSRKTFRIQIQKDYYNILKVPANATQEQIKASFYNLVKRNLSKFDSIKLNHISKLYQAYAVLSNPEKRKQYDHRKRPKTQKPKDKSNEQFSVWLFERAIFRVDSKLSPQEKVQEIGFQMKCYTVFMIVMLIISQTIKYQQKKAKQERDLWRESDCSFQHIPRTKLTSIRKGIRREVINQIEIE